MFEIAHRSYASFMRDSNILVTRLRYARMTTAYRLAILSALHPARLASRHVSKRADDAAAERNDFDGNPGESRSPASQVDGPPDVEQLPSNWSIGFVGNAVELKGQVLGGAVSS